MHHNDIPREVLKAALQIGRVACDLETTGLDILTDKAMYCQLFVPPKLVHIVRLSDTVPGNVKSLLQDPRVLKIFHQALFDLSFLRRQYGVKGVNVACTKVASKLTSSRASHSLKSLLGDHLGISVSKELQKDDWAAQPLSPAHIEYMANDVLYLPALFDVLCVGLRTVDRWSLAERCFEFLPERAELALLALDDVFTY